MRGRLIGKRDNSVKLLLLVLARSNSINLPQKSLRPGYSSRLQGMAGGADLVALLLFALCSSGDAARVAPIDRLSVLVVVRFRNSLSW